MLVATITFAVTPISVAFAFISVTFATMSFAGATISFAVLTHLSRFCVHLSRFTTILFANWDPSYSRSRLSQSLLPPSHLRVATHLSRFAFISVTFANHHSWDRDHLSRSCDHLICLSRPSRSRSRFISVDFAFIAVVFESHLRNGSNHLLGNLTFTST